MSWRRDFWWWLVAGLIVAQPVRAMESEVARPTMRVEEEAAQLLRTSMSETPRSEDEWMRDSYRVLRDHGWWWARLRWAASVLEIDPGPRAELRELQWRGGSENWTTLFTAAAGLRPGAVISSADWKSRLYAGLQAVGEEGYPFASVGLVSVEADSSAGAVDLVMSLFLERRRKVGKVEVFGADHTRPQALARLSGIRVGEWFDQRSIDEAGERWRQRGLVDAVLDRAVRPMAMGEEDGVGVELAVRQRSSFGRAAAALGIVRDASGESRVSGEVELALLDLFGTAREFSGRWNDDGVARRRLRMEYLEPLAFGLPFDLRLALATLHEDTLYDRVDLGIDAQLLGTRGRSLEFHGQLERSTFAGESGRIRWRRRLGATLGWRGTRPAGAGFYGALVSRVDAAQIAERSNIGETTEVASRSTTQTLVDAQVTGAYAFSGTVALEMRAHWSSVEGAELPLPRGEQWTLGGARSVRGYREEQFHGERVGYGGASWWLGPEGSGQAYLFADLGWIRESYLAEEILAQRENWLFGFGVGLRSPTRAGALDLSIGFAERVSLDRGKLHLALTQEF